MESFFTNPGLKHIGYRILASLDTKNQLNCRLVCKSWKDLVEDSYFGYSEMKYWLEKCFEKRLFLNYKNAWEELIFVARQNQFKSILKFYFIRMFEKIDKKPVSQIVRSFFFEDNLKDMKLLNLSPLHIYAELGDLEMVKFLAEQVLDIVDVTNCILVRQNWTPIHEAASKGHSEVVKYLLDVFDAEKELLEIKDDNDIFVHFRSFILGDNI